MPPISPSSSTDTITSLPPPARDVDPFTLIPIPATDPGIPHHPTTKSFWHTQPSAFLHSHRTTLTLPSSVSTIIIGSGIAGAQTFHHLRSLSLHTSTLLLEARQTCYGATGRNGGHCKPALYQYGSFVSYCSIFGTAETVKRIEFELLNLKILTDYARERECADEIEFAETPTADVYYARQHLEIARGSLKALEKAAPKIAAMCRLTEDPAELRDVLRTPTAVGAVVFRAAKLWPYKLVAHILTSGIREAGLNLQTSTPALSISRCEDGKRWVVNTDRGAVTADRVIVAANAHTAHLLPTFRGKIYPVRAQMSALTPPRSMRDRPLSHTYSLVRRSRRTSDYLIQRPSGGELMLGGGRQLDENMGVGICSDATISPTVARHLREAIPFYFAEAADDESEPDDMDLRQSFIEKFRRLSVWDAAEGIGFERDDRGKKELKPRNEWSGIMGYSADECPFVGRVPGAGGKGLYVCAGFEGHGMALASGSAKALATIIQADLDGCEVEHTGLFEWFPRSFLCTAKRLGMEEEEEEWVVVKNDEADDS